MLSTSQKAQCPGHDGKINRDSFQMLYLPWCGKGSISTGHITVSSPPDKPYTLLPSKAMVDLAFTSI